jgi:hydrogenase maturation protein HypF
LFPQFSPVTNSSIRLNSLQNGVEIRVRGIVQGVGFRPFVFQLASRFSIGGSVTNTSDGVVIKAYAPETSLNSFLTALVEQAPPLARIISIDHRPLAGPPASDAFTILPSEDTGTVSAIIPPDIALCDDCLQELRDPADHRYRYPFINCTNCGPRFSIIETLPYDRPRTSMKRFPMCRVCTEEYENPNDRRYHAQPNACPICGPELSWQDRDGTPIATDDIITAALTAIRRGAVLAIRGLGGFHLCVDACSETAVALLRRRKKRPAKPLAVMVADLEAARRLCYLSDDQAAVLSSPQHPIVLITPRPRTELADNLAPQMSDIGIMLPYTPLHHLLFSHVNCPTALVMTSGNIGGEPICTGNEEALRRLAGLVDYFLLHNRDIVTRVDDSVVKFVAGLPRLIRRSRGYVPAPILVPYELPVIIGCGGGLKSTFSLARGNAIFPSQHIGDLFNLPSYDFYQESVANLKRLLAIEPVAACCDLHPDYLSSHFARDLGLPLYRIQHHHAHAVAVMAEHALTNPVLAVILDGTGYGSDGTIWGGELFRADLNSFSRLGSLEPLPLPGGDAASSEPWRMAMASLYRCYGEQAGESPLLAVIDADRRRVVLQMLESGFNTPLTSSCGRLFDAIAALLGLQMVSSFEGEAAMRLEACARQALSNRWHDHLLVLHGHPDDLSYRENEQRWEIISSEFVKRMIDDLGGGSNRFDAALRFHSWLITRISHLVEKLAGRTGITDIVLSGGCLQNGLLLDGLLFVLSQHGFSVFSGAQIPSNDGGISVGQAVIGGLQHVSCRTNES